jgi:hypothetical protein
MKRIALSILLTALLAGCATVPAGERASAVPSDRVTAFQTPTDGDATIIVTRDTGMMGSACTLAIFIDGKQAAELEPGERAVFHVPSGPRIIGTWMSGNGLCGIQKGKNRVEIDASVKPGDVRRFRIGYGAENGPAISPTTL